MTLSVSGKVGPATLSDGSTLAEFYQLKNAGMGIGQVQPPYQESTLRGQLYMASNQAGIASAAGLTTASKNFTLYNPAGSGVNLLITRIKGMCSVDPVADGAWYLVGNLTQSQTGPASVAAETVYSTLLGGTAGKGLVYNTATLAAAPVVIRPLFGVAWGTAVGFGQTAYDDRVDGEIAVQPGIYVSIQATAIITGIWSMTWREVPLAG